MLLKNTEKNKIVYAIFMFTSLISCGNKNQNINIDKQEFDSIVYILPETATLKIENSLLKDKNVCHCWLLSNSSKNEYIFSFYYETCEEIKSNRTKQLLKKTNRYLNVSDKNIPILSIEDKLFSNMPQDSLNYRQESNYGFISVDAKGEILDWGIW